MLIANDMALLTFLPLGYFVLHTTGKEKYMAFTFVMQNISVENVTDKSATITWEDGLRKADYYTISRVAYDINGKEQYYPLAGAIKSVDGKCSYTINNLQHSNTSYLPLKRYNSWFGCKNRHKR